MKQYEVTINFCGFIGADENYTVYANNKDEAIEEALDQARDDLSVESTEYTGGDEWIVTVGFCGYVGVSYDYEVYCDDQDDAEMDALDEASYDLTVTEIEEIEDDD